MKEHQLFLMKRVETLTTELHHIIQILDLISQLVEQDEEDEMKQPKLMRSCNIEESSDDESFETNDIQLLDEFSEEE